MQRVGKSRPTPESVGLAMSAAVSEDRMGVRAELAASVSKKVGEGDP